MAYRDPALKLLSHVYWHQKKEFMFERDDYPCWTLFAVEEGSFFYEIRTEQGEARFGDLVLCPPRTVFRRKTIEPLTFHFIQFIGESHLEHEAAWKGKLSVQDLPRLTSSYRYLRSMQGWDEESTQHKLHLVNDLFRIVQMENLIKESSPATIIDGDMDQARGFLTDHAFGNLSMLELATSLGLTPVQFTRRFRKAFAQTPTEFINDLRLTRAKHLLENTTFTLDMIAAQCGYENGFYLSRVFTQKIGKAPSLYRSMHRV
ncbi:helix-turn-helix domain-containing protein [Paenibacillus sp. LMG 31461]|uniref:Helix-turn-helix domain-containing protein n=1 Tax=Paenibacillus plantarum TaxID=2654975 RepID=A0ABX1XFI6_9BACL|nr:AraC family transcriptional regulator [Paenibacillus plantarum]NOU67260.1 helix-turn-helix domain-containing protein [Paenibacillus plantarum]